MTPELNKQAVWNIRPDEFSIVDSLRQYLQKDGTLDVPKGHMDYAIYGPYWPMQAGLYVVSPNIFAEDEQYKLGIIEICDRGIVLASINLFRFTVLTARLPNIGGLEIRIKAGDAPFKLISVMLAYFPTNPNKQLIEGVNNEAAISLAEEFLATPLSEKYEKRLPLPNIGLDLIIETIHSAPDPDLIQRLIEDRDLEKSFKSWILNRNSLKIFDIWDENLEINAEALRDFDLDISATRIAADDRHSLSAHYAEQAGLSEISAAILNEGDNDDTHVSLDWFGELKKVQGGFSKLASASGRAYITCPFTGIVISTQHCFTIPYFSAKQIYLFYRFESVHTFYVVVGGFSASKMFIYIPKKNVLLRLHPALFEWGTPQGIIDHFTKFILFNAPALCRYLLEETQPAVISGTLNNLGHFFWNEVSGVMKYAKAGYIKAASVALACDFAFIDPFRLIDDQLLRKRFSLKGEQEIFDKVIAEKLFCVRPIDHYISDEVAAKILALASIHASPKQLSLIAQANKCDYLLWAGVRRHNKVWLNQVDGICAVISKLALMYKKVAVYVDGTPDCRDVLESLHQAVPTNVEIYSGIDVSIYDSIAWSNEIDSYIATIGSGLTIVTWIAGKPGIAHSESHHLGQMSFWGDARRGVPLPITPDRDQIIDVGDHAYCDYKIEPDVMSRLFDKLRDGKRDPTSGFFDGIPLPVDE